MVARQHGAELLGVWILLSSYTAVVSLVESGVVPYLTRELLERGETGAVGALVSRQASSLKTLLAALTVALLLALFSWLSLSKSVDELLWASAFTAVGMNIQIFARLDSALAIARNHNSYVALCSAVSQALFFMVAALGSVFGAPLLGFGVGTVLQGVALYLLVQRVSAFHTQHTQISNEVSIASRFADSANLLRNSRHFLGSSAGLVIRQPVARFSLAVVGGLETVAMFDAAMRITVAIRELIAGGFPALFPFLIRAKAQSNPRLTIEVCQTSLMIILTLTATAYSIGSLFAEQLLFVWLGINSPELTAATHTMFLWGFITGFNLVFWYLLQAHSYERFAARAVLAHAALLLCLVPLGQFTDIDVEVASYYWLATSMITQAYIYFHTHKRTGLLVSILSDRRIIFVTTGGCLIVLLSGITKAAGHTPQLIALASVIACYFALSLLAIYGPVARLYARLRA
jgi:O-antigen/teichoic acid export membrane protein